MAKVKTTIFSKLYLASSILSLSIFHLHCHTHRLKRMPLLLYWEYNFTPAFNLRKKCQKSRSMKGGHFTLMEKQFSVAVIY